MEHWPAWPWIMTDTVSNFNILFNFQFIYSSISKLPTLLSLSRGICMYYKYLFLLWTIKWVWKSVSVLQGIMITWQRTPNLSSSPDYITHLHLEFKVLQFKRSEKTNLRYKCNNAVFYIKSSLQEAHPKTLI